MAELLAEQEGGYREIGRFLFEFSQLEFTIRVQLAGLLKLPEDNFDIVTSPYDFAMLCTVTQALALKHRPENAEVIREVFSSCRALNDRRVHVAHGLWTLGGEGLVVRHVSRASLHPKFHFERVGDLRRLADEAQRLIGRMFEIVK